MINKKENKQKSPGTLLLLVGAMIVGIGLVYWFLTPKVYQAAARLQLDPAITPNGHTVSIPDMIPAECDLILSNAVLDATIQHLGLDDSWGRRFHNGVKLTPDEARNHLLSKLMVRPLAFHNLIEVRAASDIPAETARIVNEISSVYLENRKVQRNGLVQKELSELKQQWEQQNQKVRDAQADLDKLYFDIMKWRETNKVYGADAYNSIVSNRVDLEAQYVNQSTQLATLKKLDRNKVAQVLSSMDTNSLVTPALDQLNKAQNQLVAAQQDHAADSREVKDAKLVIETLNSNIDQLVTTSLALKETDAASLKAMLDDLNTRAKAAISNPVQAKMQDEKYAKALEAFNKLKDDRDRLQAKMTADESVGANIVPQAVTVRLIDRAEIPPLPFMPSPKVTLGTLTTGVATSFVGVMALFIKGRRLKSAARQR